MRDVRRWRARAQAALFFLALSGGAVAVSGCGATGGKPVAVVNGEQLSEKDFQHLCEIANPEQFQQGRGTVGLQVLGSWILNTLVTQEAKKLKVYPSEEELNRLLEERRKQATFFGQDFDQQLQRQGMSLADYKQGLVNQMTQENVMLRGITVSDEEIKSAFEREKKTLAGEETARISQITVSSEAKAKQAASELGANGDFALIASSYSQDMFKQNGGKLPQPVPRKIPPTLPISQAAVDAAFKLKPGQISDPVKVGATWVIVKLDELIPKKEPVFEDFKDTVRSALRRQKAQTQSTSIAQENQRVTMEATQNAKIEINRPEYKQLAEKGTGGPPPGMPPGVGGPGGAAPEGAGAPPAGVPGG